MRRTLFGILAGCALLLPAGTAGAQQSPTLRGYLEHQFSAGQTRHGWSQLDYDRLRVDLDAEAGRGSRISAAMIWQVFRGNTRPDFAEYFPRALAGQVPATALLVRDRHDLSHIYLALRPGPVDVIAGKQYLNWGKSMVFNPTELFRPKNLVEPGYEREGVGALSARLTLGDLSDVQAAYVPAAGFQASGKVVRLRSHLSGFDLSALAAETWERGLPPTLGGDPGPLRRRWTVGGDLSGELLGLGVWMEGTWSTRDGEAWMEFTLGGNYILPGGTLIALEGYYDERGKWTEPYPFPSWLAVATGDRRTLGRGMVFGLVQHPASDLLQVGLSGLGNTGDRSMLLIPTLTYGYAQDVDIIFNGLVAIGPDGTEFGSRGGGGFLRARVYF